MDHKLSLFTQSILHTPPSLLTVVQMATCAWLVLGPPSTRWATQIMAGMEHDMRSKPAIWVTVSTAVHKGIRRRSKFHSEHAAGTVACGGRCSSAMESNSQQLPVALTRRNRSG